METKPYRRPLQNLIPGFDRPLGNGTIFLLLFLLSLVIRFIGINLHGLAIDEPYTVWHAQMPIHEMLKHLETDNHPPLFEFIMYGWIQTFGISEIGLRTLPAIFGALTAGFIFLIGKVVFSRSAGILAAILFAFGTQQIFYAQEARGYTLMLLLTMMGCWFIISWMENGKILPLILWTLSMIALLYTNYFGVAVLAMQAGWALLFSILRKKQKIIPLIIAFTVIAVSFLPQLNHILNRGTTAVGNHWVPLVGFNPLWNTLAKFFNSLTLLIIAGITMIVAVILFFYRKLFHTLRENPGVILLLLIFPVTYVAFWLAGTKWPVFLDRYVLFTSGAIYLLWSGAFHFVFSGKMRIVLGILILGLYIFTCNFHLHHIDDWPEVSAEVHSFQKSEKEAVLFYPDHGYLGLAYYYDNSAFKDWKNTEAKLIRKNFFALLPGKETSFRSDNYDRIMIIRNGKIMIEPERSFMENIHASFKEDSTSSRYRSAHFTYYTRKK